MKNIVIPYGVVKTDEYGYIKEMKEKPDYSFMVNTGLYLMEPEAINEIEDGEITNDLINTSIKVILIIN